MDGKGDLAAANLTITPERQALVDFSAPLMEGVREILVTGPSGAQITKLEDLSGREVHVRKSSSYHASLRRVSAELQRAGKAPIKVMAADEQLEDEDLLEMVNAGLIPATVVDNHLAAFLGAGVRAPRGARRRRAEGGWTNRVGTPQGQPEDEGRGRRLRQQARAGLAAGQRHPAALPEERRLREERRGSRRTAQVQRAGPALPHLRRSIRPALAAAGGAGYQESQLDENRRSSAGAVGVMQIKPTTHPGRPSSSQASIAARSATSKPAPSTCGSWSTSTTRTSRSTASPRACSRWRPTTRARRAWPACGGKPSDGASTPTCGSRMWKWSRPGRSGAKTVQSRCEHAHTSRPTAAGTAAQEGRRRHQ